VECGNRDDGWTRLESETLFRAHHGQEQGVPPYSHRYVCLELPGRTRQANWLDESITLVEAGPSKIVKVAQDSTLAPFVPQWKKIFATAVDNTARTYNRSEGRRPHTFFREKKETGEGYEKLNSL
jgi:hypothetical protein